MTELQKNTATAETAVEQQKTGKWLISSDGYYPYCSECGNEPNWSIVKFGLPDHCPLCKAEMLNTETLNNY